MSYRLVAPYIRWGTNLANALYLPFPLDNVFSGDEPRQGSEFVQGESGFEDAWIPGTDYVLQGTARWIPQSDTLFYPRATGWDGTLGVRAALSWMKQKNLFAWHSDGRNLVRHSGLLIAGDAIGGTAGSTTTIYNEWVGAKNGTPTAPTVSYDGVSPGWQLSASGSTGASDVDLRQRFPVIPGESLCLSAEYATFGLSGGANGVIGLLIWDAAGTSLLQTHASLSGLASGPFVRVSTGFGAAVTPAGSAFAEAILRLTLPNGAAGNIVYRKALVRRDSTDATYIDNQSIDSYLVDPIQFSPANEAEGSRQLALKIRNYVVPYDGY